MDGIGGPRTPNLGISLQEIGYRDAKWGVALGQRLPIQNYSVIGIAKDKNPVEFAQGDMVQGQYRGPAARSHAPMQDLRPRPCERLGTTSTTST